MSPPELQRRCKTCGRKKPITSFHMRGSGRRRVSCKSCNNKRIKDLSTPAKRKRASATQKTWYAANGERQRTKRCQKYASSRALRQKILRQSADYYEKHKEAIGRRNKRHRAKLKADLIAAYGGCCSCCGEKEQDFLTVDHVKGDGKAHRASVTGSSTGVYRDLRDRGYPKEGYTILCFNCNIARSLFGVCPHQRAQHT
jgi:hypothetical protein